MANIENFITQLNSSQGTDLKNETVKSKRTDDDTESRVEQESNQSIDDWRNLSLDELWQACDANPKKLINLISEFIGRRAGHVEHSFEAYSCASNAVQSALNEVGPSDRRQSGQRVDNASNSELNKFELTLKQSCRQANCMLSKCSKFHSTDDSRRRMSKSAHKSESFEHCQNALNERMAKQVSYNDSSNGETNSKSTNQTSNDTELSRSIVSDIMNNAMKTVSSGHLDNQIRSTYTQNDNLTGETIVLETKNQGVRNDDQDVKCSISNCDVQTAIRSEHAQSNSSIVQSISSLNFGHITSKHINSNTRMLNNEDCYNGSVIYDPNDNQLIYSWSQSLDELEITIPISKKIQNKNQCKIIVRSNELKVMLNEPDFDLKSTEFKVQLAHKKSNAQNHLFWITKLDGRLAYSIRSDTVYWTLESGRCLRLFLEKVQAGWWNCLLDCETKLDLNKLEKIVPYDQLTIEEQNVVQQLAYQQIEKLKKSSNDQ